MPLRTRLFIIISIFVLLVLGISIVLYISSKKNTSGTATSPTTNTSYPSAQYNPNVTTPTIIPSNVTVKPPTGAAAEENTVKQIAKVFVERYNTYSSDASYQNIRDVQSLVTEGYWKKLGAKLNTPAVNSGYVASISEVIVADVTVLKDGAASVTIKTRRSLTSKGTTTTDYQTLVITLAKESGEWLVDSQTVGK